MQKALPRLLLLWMVLLFLGLFLIAPLLQTLGRSFFWQGWFSLAIYGTVLTTPGTLELLLVSCNVALAATALSLAFGGTLALMNEGYRFKGQSLLQLLLIIPIVLPPFVGAVGIRTLLSRFGPLNLLLMKLGLLDAPLDFLGNSGHAGVALAQALHLFPIVFLQISAGLKQINPSLHEAAAAAGARPLRTFLRITFPLLLPGIFAAGSLVFISVLTDLGTPLIFGVNDVVAVRIFDLLDEMHVNPVGHVLVVVLCTLTLGVFLVSRAMLPNAANVMGGKTAAARRPPHPKGLWRVLVPSAVAGFVLLALVPHGMVVLLSVSENWSMRILPEFISGTYYREVLGHPRTASALLNSLVLSGASTVLVSVLGVVAAVFIVRGRRHERRLLDTLTTLPLAVPGVVLAFGYLTLFRGGWLDPRVNPMPLLVAGYAIRRLPFMVKAVVAGLEVAGQELEEAGYSVGASAYRVAHGITLPLVARHIGAGALLVFAFGMLEVSESMMLALEERFYPLSKAMYALLARPDGMPLASALGVVGMTVVLGCLAAARYLSGGRGRALVRGAEQG